MNKVVWVGLLSLVLCVCTINGYCDTCEANPVVVKQKQVQYDPRYYLGLDGYYSVGQKVQADEQANTLNDISTKLDVLIQLLSKGGLAQPPNPRDPPTPVEPTEPEPTTPTEPNEPATKLDNEVFRIFKTNCAKCHNEVKQNGKLQLVNEKNNSLLYLDIADRVVIYKNVFSGKMPLAGARVSDKDTQILLDWAVEEAKKAQQLPVKE